jgi:prephenate dehydratase
MSKDKKIAFQGDPGANSHEACRTYFPDYEASPCATFEDAFEAVRSGACALALIPVENSLAGRVADVHHLLPSSGLKIVGERFMPISSQLMANKGAWTEGLRTVISHPMALAQCRKVIKRLGLVAHPVYDTAGAARMLAEQPDPTKAAIAPALAAEIYGLDILMRDVEDERHNTTRFLVMTGDPSPPRPAFTEQCITAFVFRVRNVPAALYKAMGGFATNGVNMTKLESYMENGSFSATMFYAEVEGRPEDRGLAIATEELNFFCDHFELLGVFPADPFRTRV